MINEVLLLLGIPAGTILFMFELEILGYRVYPLIVRVLNFKPFTCELCLSFWAYYGIAGYIHGYDLYNLLGAFISAFLGNFYAKQITKF
jgi:hypothetical protein